MPNIFSTLTADFHSGTLVLVLVLFYVGSLVCVPWAVVRVPADFFKKNKRQPTRWGTYHPVLRLGLLLLKNISGILLVLAGIAMFLLPGQGLLTILMGILLLDFPGKFRCERWLISNSILYKTANWIRIKNHRLPLEID